MAQFKIYNMATNKYLGTREGETENQALDAMARDFGFADHADAIREYGITVEEAKAELRVTRVVERSRAVKV